jgi:hypothetical protein
MRWSTILLLALVGLFTSAQAEALSPEATRLIDQAGNTEDEQERLAALEKLATLPLDPVLHAEVEALVEFVKRWNPIAGRLNFFLYNFGAEGQQRFKDYEFPIRADSPLRPIAEFYRGRIFAWFLTENGHLRHDPALAAHYKDEALSSFRTAEKAFPHNRLPGVYLGRPIAWPKSYPPAPGAPAWALLEREHLDRLREIIHWWIDHRQQADGSFGGGWGDDCEMRRWWSPLLFCFDDPKIAAAQIRFSTASMARPEMKDSFLAKVRDVEHSAEDSTDNLIPLLLLQPDEPHWRGSARSITKLMERNWTGINKRGELQFRGFYFGANELDPAPEHAYDVIGNVLALTPAFFLWRTSPDPELARPLTAWLDTWVAATARAENGKPAGILPAAIRWPDGQVSGVEGRWWEPLPLSKGSGANYYLWPSVLPEMTDALITARLATGDEKYLAPIRSMAAIRLKYLQHLPSEPAPPGTEAWCASQLGPKANTSKSQFDSLFRTLVKCKTLIGTSEFDELIRLERAEGTDPVEQALQRSIELLRSNFASYTSEVRYTDRVLSFPRFLAQGNGTDGVKGVELPHADVVYRMTSGDDGSVRAPQPAVRWITPPQDIAVRVTAADSTHFEAALYHFGDKPRPITAELQQLAAGRYKVELLQDGKPIGRELEPLNFKPPRTLVKFELPPQKLCTLRITANAAAPKLGERFIPTDVDTGRVVYTNAFDDPKSLEDWRMEGGKSMSIQGGNLVLESNPEKKNADGRCTDHLVCWLQRELPPDFLIEFGVKPRDRHDGLNIAFFSARGVNGESIFDPTLQPRDGTFPQYHSGDLNCYHVSYWAGTRESANLRKNKGFHLVTSGMDLIGTGSAGGFQTVRIYKRGGVIRVTVDEILALAWEDDGKQYGPVLTHPGWFGLRQMGYTLRCEYSHVTIYPLGR